MYKFIDGTDEDVFQGFAFTGVEGDKNWVKVNPASRAVEMSDDCEGRMTIFVKDVPKMIEALQAAYDYHQSENDKAFIQAFKSAQREK